MSGARFYRIYDQALPPDLCRTLIKTFDEDTAGQEPGKLLNDSYPQTLKVSTDIHIGDRLIDERGRHLWAHLDSMLFDRVQATWESYQKDVPALRFVSPERGYRDTGYQIQRYEKGKGKFGPHVDAGSVASSTRVAAAVIYLNTVEEGGGTRFVYHDETIDAVEGRILWFPAAWTHVHQGLIPLSGPKYIVSTFMRYKETS